MIIFSDFITVLLFSVFALCCSETCMNEKTNQCLDKSFLRSLNKAATKSEIHAELQNCFRDSQIECGEIYAKDSKEDKYCYIDDLGNEQCSDNEQSYDAQLCLDEYMGYIAGCASENVANAAEVLQEKGLNDQRLIDHVHEDVFTCGVSLVSFKCALNRSEEKCGIAGREIVMKEFQKSVDSLIDSCKEADPTQLHLLEMILLHMQNEENVESLKE